MLNELTYGVCCKLSKGNKKIRNPKRRKNRDFPGGPVIPVQGEQV